MLRAVHKICAGLMVALGALHICFTPVNYDTFSLDAMWFFGSGVAIILAGFLNIAAIRQGDDRVIKLLCLITDLAFAALFGAGLFLLAQPQVFVGLALFAVAGVSLLLRGPSPHRS